MWSYNQRVILKRNYGKVSMNQLLEMLPGKSVSSVYAQVYYLRKRGWAI